MDIVLQHWAFLAVAVVLGVVGVVAKRVVWTADPARWRRLGRATLRLHPVVLGALVSLTALPSPGAESGAARALYFAAAGAVSSWVYDAVRDGIRRWRPTA